MRAGGLQCLIVPSALSLRLAEPSHVALCLDWACATIRTSLSGLAALVHARDDAPKAPRRALLFGARCPPLDASCQRSAMAPTKKRKSGADANDAATAATSTKCERAFTAALMPQGRDRR